MEDQGQTDRVVAVVRRAHPALGEVLVRAIVLAVATSPWARLQLARELSGQPGVLTSGRGGRHAVTQRLIVALAAAGSAAVSRPHCSLCRRTRDLPMALAGGGRACQACRDLLLGDRCPGCGRWRRLKARLSDGTPVCRDCSLRPRQRSRPRPQPSLRSRRPWRLYCDPETNDQTRTGWIVAAVRTADAELSEDTVWAALVKVAPGRVARGRIARELLTRPEVLTSGQPDSRPGTQQLVAALVAAGSRRLRQPTCAHCGRPVALPSPLPGGAGRICQRCARRLAAGTCPGCGGRKQLRDRLADGTRVCGRCARADPARREPCHRCGEVRRVARRTAGGSYCGGAGPTTTCRAPSAAAPRSRAAAAPASCCAAAAASPHA